MSKTVKIVAWMAGLAAVLLVGAYVADCVSTGTVLRFSFNTDTPADSSDVKSIYINEDMDRLTLDVKLKMDGDRVALEVLELATGKAAWNGTFKESASFKIELFGLNAGSEYVIRTQAAQTKSMKLTITSQEKLVKNEAKPSKQNR